MSRHSPSRRHTTGDGDASAAESGGGIGESGTGSKIRRDPASQVGFAASQLELRTDHAAALDFRVAHDVGARSIDRWHARDLDAPRLDSLRVNSSAATQVIANFRKTESMSGTTCLPYQKDPLEDL